MSEEAKSTEEQQHPFERFKETFLASWKRAYGEESLETLKEDLDDRLPWIFMGLPASRHQAASILERQGVRVPSSGVMRRIMRVRRFCAALRASERWAE